MNTPGGGRRRQPLRAAKLKGNPNNRPLNETEPAIEVGLPECPKILQGEARRYWFSMGAQLVREKRIGLINLSVFTRHCVSWGRFYDAEIQLAKPASKGGGVMVRSPSGHEIYSPMYTVSNKSQDQLHKTEAVLGIQPATNSRVSTVEEPPVGSSGTAADFSKYKGPALVEPGKQRAKR
jgi:P27 family predicted phage terminase small subunit